MSANNRASLLANLRTGGVRSASINMPQTAAPTVSSFTIPDAPMTAASGGSFSDSMYPYIAPNQVQMQQQAQMYQMQMLQAEIMKMQIIQQAQQAQQYQFELLRQQQQQQQAPHRRTSLDVPASAGPTATSFIGRRASQAEYLKNQLHLNGSSIAEEEVPTMPMTGALNGKFGGRLNPNATAFKFGGASDEEDQDKPWRTGSGAPANTPVTPSYTTVISGGTALGKMGANGGSSISTSKSDGVSNWRRGGNNNSMLNGNRSASLSVKITPPPPERTSPPPTQVSKARPEPLRFSVIISEPVSGVSIDGSDGDVSEGTDDASSNSDSLKSESLPTTPPSNVAITEPPLSPREAASKRLYEGLGIGRPIPQSAQVHTMSFPGANENELAVNVPHTSVGLAFPTRVGSQPMRQPRGPPCGLDELGSKNFASRIRRKAIGGLGAMLDARVNRREIEAF